MLKYSCNLVAAIESTSSNHFSKPRKDFLDMVKYASSKKIYTATSTNAHYLDDENARRTVESGLDRLEVGVEWSRGGKVIPGMPENQGAGLCKATLDVFNLGEATDIARLANHR